MSKIANDGLTHLAWMLYSYHMATVDVKGIRVHWVHWNSRDVALNNVRLSALTTTMSKTVSYRCQRTHNDWYWTETRGI